jgi:two-component system OmpR family response regulator
MEAAKEPSMYLRHGNASSGAIAIESAEENLPPQILVVDDVKEVREMIIWFLRSNGYRALAAADGLAAQVLLSREHPVLVISDLEMPDGDGWELLAFCHAHRPGLPVLIISGSSLGTRPEIECWASGILHKPFAPDRLRAEVQRLVSQTASRR